MEMDNRIMVLTGSSVPNLNTLSTLINGDLNIVGAVIANQKYKGINTGYLKVAVKKQGLLKVILQIVGRIVYTVLNHRKDKRQFKNIFNTNEIHNTINGFKENIYNTFAYDSPETIEWIKSKKPDLIVIHTPYWVSKKVRDIVQGKVIGGHPGITQFYRGVHSPFWAVYNNDYKNIGYSTFWVDSGVDSGDIITQGKIIPEKEDSYMTLSWKGMNAIALEIKSILEDIDSIEQIPRNKNNNLSEDTIYYHPTIFNYLVYRIKHKLR